MQCGRVWREGEEGLYELSVGPSNAIKKQSRLEKRIRKAVKKDPEMVRHSPLSMLIVA